MRILLVLSILISSVCFADRKGTDGETQTFDAEFERVWSAALIALDDKTIDQANKEIGQITTKAERGHNFTGETSKSVAVKVSHAKPCKVTVHANVERTVSVGRFGMVKGTDTYSDDGLEKDILKSIEKGLGVK